MRSWIVAALFAALLCGSCSVSADNGKDDGSVTTLHKPGHGRPTAWEFITGRPDLAFSAYVLEVLGLHIVLGTSFSGTLLLPTDQAWEEYRAQYAVYENEVGNALGPIILDEVGSFNAYYRPLMNYHFLRRAIDTRSSRSLTVDTRHFQEPGFEVPNEYHQLTMLTSCSKKPYKGAKDTKDVSTRTFGHTYCQINSIRDEQGYNATIASANNRVAGGGVIHIINSVLQPDDVYPSFDSLAAANPDVSKIAGIIQWWESYANYTNYPWRSPFPFYNYTLQTYEEVPPFSPPLLTVAAADARAAEVKPQKVIDQLKTFEHMMGTMALPNNDAFDLYEKYPDEPGKWCQLVKYHFIPAPAKGADLVRTERGKWNKLGPQVTYLGIRESNNKYALSYQPSMSISFTPSRGQASVPISKDRSGTFKKQLGLSTPGKFYHVISVEMVPDIPRISDDCI